MTRPTPRGVALVAVAVATYVAARIVGAWELYLIALAFAGMVAVAWGAVVIGGRHIDVRRHVAPERPLAGDPMKFTFSVWNESLLPGLHVTLMGATGQLAAGGALIDLESLGARAARNVVVGPWPARRGVHQLTSFLARIEDPLGLARAHRLVGEPLQLTVPPRLDDLSSCAACVDVGVLQGGGRRRLRTRDASEFHAVRPHLAGEPLNRVDWKSTAKTGNLMLREMEAAAEGDLTVLVNGTVADSQHLPDAMFEAAVRAAGSVAAFTLSTGHEVTLLLSDDDWRPIRLTPDSSGRRRLLTALAKAEPTGLARLGPSLPAILAPRRPQARRRVLTLVVLSLDDQLAHALISLREQGASISVIHVVDQSEHPTPSRGTGRGAGRDAGLDRALAAGVRYIRVTRDDDLRTALAAGLENRRAQVGAR